MPDVGLTSVQQQHGGNRGPRLQRQRRPHRWRPRARPRSRLLAGQTVRTVPAADCPNQGPLQPKEGRLRFEHFGGTLCPAKAGALKGRRWALAQSPMALTSRILGGQPQLALPHGGEAVGPCALLHGTWHAAALILNAAMRAEFQRREWGATMGKADGAPYAIHPTAQLTLQMLPISLSLPPSAVCRTGSLPLPPRRKCAQRRAAAAGRRAGRSA